MVDENVEGPMMGMMGKGGIFQGFKDGPFLVSIR